MMGLVDICKALKCVKAINLQFLSLTVDSWCQISHRNVLVQYIQHLNVVIHHYIMDFGSKYPKWWVWLTYANVRSVWKPLICNFLPWQLTPDVRYLAGKVLVQYSQHLNAVMHHYIMDFDSKYVKLWVWLTYADVRSVWKPLICNLFHWQLTSWCQISHRKSFGATYPEFERSYASLYHGFWLKISKIMGFGWHMKRSKCVKAINLQFLSLTVDSWCQISHKKGFGAIYPAFERSYASVYHGFWLKISQMMGLVDICKRSNCVTAINLQFLPWQLTPDVRYLTEKFWCHIYSFWTQLCMIISWILTQNIQHDGFGWHMQRFEVCEKQLICNFFPWQLAPDVRYLT